MTAAYRQRFYRYLYKPAFSLEVAYRESDLHIISDKKLDAATVRSEIVACYTQIEQYVQKNNSFLNALSPLPLDAKAPPVIQKMMEAGSAAGVGPFAAVAGALASEIGEKMLAYCSEIIVENGGDIFLNIQSEKKVGLCIGEGFDPESLVVKLSPRPAPFGVCSSSSVIGPSLNFGLADLCTVIAKTSSLADALATAYSNRIRKKKDIDALFIDIQRNPMVYALVVVFQKKIFLWGDIAIES